MTERQPLLVQDEMERGRPRPDYRSSPDNIPIDVNSDDSGKLNTYSKFQNNISR